MILNVTTGLAHTVSRPAPGPLPPGMPLYRAEPASESLDCMICGTPTPVTPSARRQAVALRLEWTVCPKCHARADNLGVGPHRSKVGGVKDQCAKKRRRAARVAPP